MQKMGYKDVKALAGGWREWEARYEKDPLSYPVAQGMSVWEKALTNPGP